MWLMLKQQGVDFRILKPMVDSSGPEQVPTLHLPQTKVQKRSCARGKLLILKRFKREDEETE